VRAARPDHVGGAIRLPGELGARPTIVTILADSGTRYQPKLFQPGFLKEKNLPTRPGSNRTTIR